MGIVAGGHERYRASVLVPVCVRVDASMQTRGSAQREHPQESSENEHSDTSTRRRGAFHCWRVSGSVPESARLFLRKSAWGFDSFRFVPPEMKSVSENYVAEQ